MPNYPLVSAKEVLANIVRGTNYTIPSSYGDDILEWIAEGLGLLQVTNTLIIKETGDEDCPGELLVKNHCAKLPCGFVNIKDIIDAVGNKLYSGYNVKKKIRQNIVDGARVTVFNVDPFTYQTSTGLPTNEPGPHVPFFGEDIVKESDDIAVNQPYYEIIGNHIQTSFEEGFIKMRYLAMPVCDEGYPLIPDNTAFKLALEWHVLKRLIGAGYEHKIFDYKFADSQYKEYAALGMGEVSYYSPDKAAQVHRTLIRLIPPDRYEEEFFINS